MQVSMKISIVIKPRNLEPTKLIDFTVPGFFFKQIWLEITQLYGDRF